MILSMKSLIKHSLVIFSLSLSWHSSLAIDFVAVRDFGYNEKIQKETLVLNVGTLDGYVEGETADLFIENGTPDFPDSKNVALVELVKALPKYSYWQIVVGKTGFSKNNLKKKSGEYVDVGLIRTNSGLNGRPLDIKNKVRLFERETDQYLGNEFGEIPPNLRQDSEYEALKDTIFEEKKLKRADVEVVSNDYLEKKASSTYSDEHLEELEELYAPSLKVVKKESVEKAVKDDIRTGLSENYERNKERTKYGLNDFYREQERTPEFKDIRKKVSSVSVYDEEKESQFEESMISKRALKKMDRDRERWSQDMDDQVLRRYFVQNGIEAEYQRRERALNELEGHEMWLRFFGGVNRNTHDEDPNYQRMDYSLAVGYNLHFSRISMDLKNWSMDFLLENSVNHYALNDELNAQSKDLFAGTFLNYYWLNNPLTLNKFIGHVGVGMKIGQGDAVSVSGVDSYSYQIIGLPSLAAGLKYRFRAGDLTRDTLNVGAAAAFGVQYDRLNYSSSELLDDGEIYSKFSTNTIKYYFGLHFYY